MLSQHPRRYLEIRRLQGQSVRKLVWRGYVALFLLSRDVVTIVRIVHGSRDRAAPIDADDPDRA